jgi:hypothetical protein
MKVWTEGKIYAQISSRGLIAITKAVNVRDDTAFFTRRFVGIELWYFWKTLCESGTEIPYLWDADYQMVEAPPIVLALCGISLDDKY